MYYIRLSWDDIYHDCKIIARELRNKKVSTDIIIGIARGGLVPARILSDLLDNDELHIVRVKFYESVGKTAKEPKILHATQFSISGKKILLVDDIADTGKSLKATFNHLKEKNASEIFVVTLVKKPHSIFNPDLYVRETSAWVIFPWEVYETIRELIKQGKSEEEIINAGIKREELEEVKRKIY